MNSKIIAFFAIFAVLIGTALCNTQEDESSIKLHFYTGSSIWWIAVDPRNDRYNTVKVEIREASESEWTTLMYFQGWDYFHISSTSGRGFALPLSFRLTSETGEQVITAAYRISSNFLFDTKTQYGSSSTTAPTQPATEAPTQAPTQPATEAPTEAPTQPATEAPTQAPTQPATEAPTVAPTQPATEAPTEAPTQPATEAPTQPATEAPTQAPTQPATEAPTQPATEAPTQAPTQPATQAPTVAPTTRPTTAPTTRPTTRPTTAPTTRPVTQAPTQKPTDAPTAAPTPKATEAPTAAPTPKATAAPTAAPTPKATPAPTPKATVAPTQPATVDVCSIVSTKAEPMKILVPLYVYPGAAWDNLITAANNGAKIIAIINPNSGPAANGPNSAYLTYMNKFIAAGIEMVGYVHTVWGDRSISTVNAEIGIYASKYPGVTGIFFDEASADSSDLDYYGQAYRTVLSKGFKHSILNPGTQPVKGYLDISTNIVIFENYASELSRAKYDSYVKCAPSSSQKSGYKYKFSAIIHTASQSDVSSLIQKTHDLGMGLVYVTDGPGGCCTYNYLANYFTAEANAVKALNA